MGLHCCSHSYVYHASFGVALLLVGFFALKFLVKYRKRKQRIFYGFQDCTLTVGFFHPYCNAGGGGERVLWCAIQSLQEKHPTIQSVVYTGDFDATPVQILSKAKSRFGLDLKNDVKFVFLKKRRLVEAQLYPFFTLLGQSLGGLILGFEALWSFVPDILVDSMGYAFVPPIFRYLASCQTSSYVHYPTITTEMLTMVKDRRPNFNNSTWICNNCALSNAKLIYYKFFAAFYGLAGRANDTIMVNSTWTYRHIIEIWQKPKNTLIVYPPCDIKGLKNLPNKSETLLRENGQVRILSLGQFRPEKNHQMQLEILADLFEKLKSRENFEISSENSNLSNLNVKLVLVGGCRDEADEKRVENLKKMAKLLKIEKNVEWKVNITFEELKSEFEMALVGLHTMKDEHFGMGVVESMAAGLITVANDSAGPKLDIITHRKDTVETMTDDQNLALGQDWDTSGFLASNPQEYVEMILKILEMTVDQRQVIRENARRSSDRFSDQTFKDAFLSTFDIFLT